MSCYEWLPDFLSQLESEHVITHDELAQTIKPAYRLVLDSEDWGTAGKVAATFGFRHAGLWADPGKDRVCIYACLEFQGDYIILDTRVPISTPVLASHTPYFPGVNRLERHMQDMAGIACLDHPDSRRWTRHKAWPEECYPLRSNFPVSGHSPKRTPADADYPFVHIYGSGVYEIPVGPVHASIIEPGHFRFQAVGEEVLRLEERLGYAHKGIEKIAVNRDPAGLSRLAGRVSGDSTVAHTFAACLAMEHATGCTPPSRAQYLRALMAERERVANHLGDIGAICNDVGFSFVHMQCARMREQWQRRSQLFFGHRFMMDRIIPGGVTQDLSTEAINLLHEDHAGLRRDMEPVFDVIDDHPSLADRLIGTGCLNAEDAHALGCTGYVGKASGQGFDVRRDNPYAPYDRMQLEVPIQNEGDVAARVRVRMAEIRSSLALMDQMLKDLPEGAISTLLPEPNAWTSGIGIVDGWRGEIVTFVRFGTEGRITRFFPRDPSWFTWPALEKLIHGNIVPDFPVCNKSVNGSYSGHDL